MDDFLSQGQAMLENLREQRMTIKGIKKKVLVNLCKHTNNGNILNTSSDQWFQTRIISKNANNKFEIDE